MKIINLRSWSHFPGINELNDQITKPSPEPVLTYGPNDIHLKTISQEELKNRVTKIVLKYLRVTWKRHHYSNVIMGMIASQITSLTIVYSIIYSDADQRKHQSSASLAFVRGIHWWPVNSPHKWPVTRKMFPFDDVIMLVAKTQTMCGWLCCLIWLIYNLNQRCPISFTHICTSLPRKFEQHCCVSPCIQGHSVTENPHIIDMWGRPRLEAFVVSTVASFTSKPIVHNNNTGSTASIGMINCVHNTLIITSCPVCHSWKWRIAIFINCTQVCISTQ